MPYAAQAPVSTSPVVALVVSRSDPPPNQFRALRRLEAQSDKLGNSAWIEAWTEADPAAGFSFQIVGEGGSGFVRGRVLRPWLENEKRMWAAGDPERASFTHENYTFDDRGPMPDGLVRLAVKSRRKDLLLVDVRPERLREARIQLPLLRDERAHLVRRELGRVLRRRAADPGDPA